MGLAGGGSLGAGYFRERGFKTVPEPTNHACREKADSKGVREGRKTAKSRVGRESFLRMNEAGNEVVAPMKRRLGEVLFLGA